jgi:DNA-binding transcriptional LysR family regulator
VKDVLRQRLSFERLQNEALDLNLRSLDIFVQIAESGGMSLTARRMGLTQSAVSQVIASLEQSLGVQLFDRQVRPIALTPSGLVLLEKARGVLIAARAAIKAAREPATVAFPRLNLCLVETIAGTVGPELVKSIQGFAALWSVHSGAHSQHARTLLSRECDIVFTPDPLEDEPNLERHEILKEPAFIALPKDYPTGGTSLETLAETFNFVRFSARTTMFGRQVERHLKRLRIDARGRVEFDNCDAVQAMVAGGLGWTVLTPLLALMGRRLWPKLRFEPLPGPALHRRLYVIARKGEFDDVPERIAGAAVTSLRKTIEEEFQAYPWIAAGCSIPGD